MMTDLWRRIQELDGRIGAQTGAIVSPGPRTIRPANGSSRFRGSARSRPPRWWPPWATGRRSGGDGNGLPFSGSCPASMPPGGKPRLLGISKRGNSYVRCLLIHGARAVLRGADRRTDRLGPWLRELRGRTPPNVATVALANKLARIAWAVLATGRVYEPHLISISPEG